MSETTGQLLKNYEQHLDAAQKRWVAPRGRLTAVLHRMLFAGATAFVRLGFRFRVEGRELLPSDGPVIFAPNHESSLDGPLLAAALPHHILRHTYWAVREGRVLANPFTRAVGRITRTVPIKRDTSALAAGAAVIDRKHNLVWFPEGTRSRDGELQEFKFGVGALAREFNTPVVPVAIEGAFEAWPPDARLPRLFSKVSVRFGEPLSPADVQAESEDESYEQLADEVRQRVETLADEA